MCEVSNGLNIDDDDESWLHRAPDISIHGIHCNNAGLPVHLVLVKPVLIVSLEKRVGR